MNMDPNKIRCIRWMLRHKWMLWPRLESRQMREDVWRRRVLQLGEGAARDFAYTQYIRAKRLKIRMKKRLGLPIWHKGVCEICGCTDSDPCFNPYFGYCWWIDEEHSLCSHCDIYVIQQDPHTRHCINSDPYNGYNPDYPEIPDEELW